jgi:hypothetical protein
MTRAELLAGLRRIGVIFAVVLVVTVAASLAFGLLIGSTPRRSVSVGLYVVAVVCIVLGLFQGIKPPVRPLRSASEEAPPSPVEGMLGNRAGGPIRWATGEERGESVATAGFLLGMGAILIVLGTIVDGRRALV